MQFKEDEIKISNTNIKRKISYTGHMEVQINKIGCYSCPLVEKKIKTI